jgi:hypothetical protein
VLFSRNPDGERGLLLVPVLPGSILRSVEFVDELEPADHQTWPVAAALGGTLALVAAGVVLFDRSTGTDHAAPRPARATVTTGATAAPATAAVHKPAPRPASPQQRARAAARQLAANLPVTLASTALLRSGSDLYVLGGTTRAGRPSDGIWKVDLQTGAITSVGRFVEPLTNSGAAARDGFLYLAGGWTGETAATGVLRWSPGQSSSLVTRLPVAVRSASAAFVGGRLVVVARAPKRAFAVDVAAGTVSDAANPPTLSRSQANLAYLTEAFSDASSTARG